MEGHKTYQKCTVLGPIGLFQNLWKPAGSGPAAVFTRRRAFARWKKGRKALKMREPGRNDMMAGVGSVHSWCSGGELEVGGSCEELGVAIWGARACDWSLSIYPELRWGRLRWALVRFGQGASADGRA